MRLGEGGWFGELVQEAVAKAAPLALRGRALDGHVRQALWSTGVLVGAPHDEAPGPVTPRSPADLPLLAALRFQLSLAAGLVAAGRPEASPDRRELALAALLGAHAGELSTAVVLEEAACERQALDDRARRRLVGIVGARVLRSAYLLGNPADGLPAHMLLVAVESRALGRLAAAHLDDGTRLRPRAHRTAAALAALKATCLETLAALLGVAPNATVQRQVRAASLPMDTRRRLVRALESPAALSALVDRLPRSLRPLLVDHLVLAAAVEGRTDALEPAIRELAAALGLPPHAVVSARARSLALLATWAEPAAGLRRGAPPTDLRDAARGAADAVARALENTGRELAETGELGALLARQARGDRLTDGERAKVREQLVDLAKVVPSLALLAAPGGTLLLPLVLKLLPFDLRPSAFRPGRPARPALPPAKVEDPEAA